MKRIAFVGFGFALSIALASLPVAAQSQSNPQGQTVSNSSGSSLGDYARHVRKQDTQAKARPKVYDNDNLPTQDKLSVIGPAEQASAAPAPINDNPASGGANAASNTPVAPQAVAKTSEEEVADRAGANKQWQEKINGQKDQIDMSQRELDVLQREYQLRAAAVYADAGNRMRNSADWDKQDAQYKQQIADKQKSVEEAKQKLDDMQEDARKAGVPASAREPEQSQQ